MSGATPAGSAAYQERTSAGPRLALLRSFLATEAGGAIVLLSATLVALVWANSPWGATYEAVWGTEITLSFGEYELSHSLRDWVNDGLMTLFFLLIGLEVRREFDMGEFRERRRLAVPLFAAVGGMVLPVVIFLGFNGGTEAGRGWAMVMATDTAFAVGVLALVGRRSSFRLRTFLLTLVIVDDVAAVTVIAVVYSADVNVLAIGVGLALLAVMAILRARNVQRSAIHAALGLGIWLAATEGGVHPTVAGVAIGLLTSAYPPRRASLERATGIARAFRQRPTPDLANEAARRISMSLSPNDRLQHALHPWSSYVVVPLFALANAGLVLSGDLLSEAFGSPLVIGIVLGLVVGKSVGIPTGAWLATRRWLGGATLAVGWPSLIAASTVAGIGFTMSLLIAELSYTAEQLDLAKLGIFAASVLAATLSLAMFYGLARLPRELVGRFEARTAPPITDLTDAVDPARDHIRGPIDAPLTLVEYGDYECPYCGRAAPEILRVLEEFGPRLRFVFRHLPLPDVHPSAALAAEAAEAAGGQGRFWEMHDLLFAHQEALLPSDLVINAAQLGLDVARFERDLREGAYASRVAQDINSAEEAGLAGTPGFFINEVRYRGSYDFESLSATLMRAEGAAEGRARFAEERRSI